MHLNPINNYKINAVELNKAIQHLHYFINKVDFGTLQIQRKRIFDQIGPLMFTFLKNLFRVLIHVKIYTFGKSVQF